MILSLCEAKYRGYFSKNACCGYWFHPRNAFFVETIMPFVLIQTIGVKRDARSRDYLIRIEVKFVYCTAYTYTSEAHHERVRVLKGLCTELLLAFLKL
jgi:hypothetical protein